ncbi:CRISPR-associated endonuclease Cas2 [Candidatus Gracilibacteria bacterium GN02-872]|nr:CRISPR-associated endonuclease Cas2 [Candidatus Gracilibacteria bacterium GN02-872]RKW22163.1 MAG: CRISPR-associated endonuclease Cas2 [Candidatus Gracilibacteria bacterium]
MLIVAYDIHNDKLRTKFGKLLKKFGRRLQYSVFEVKNSERILGILKTEIENIYAPRFTGADSIIVFPVSDSLNKKVLRFGQPALEEEELLFL